VDRGGKFLLEQRKQVLDVVGDVDGVGSRLALDAQDDGPFAFLFARIEPGRGLVILHVVDDVSQVLQAHRGAIAVGDDQRLVGGRAGELSAGLQREGALRTGDLARRQVHVPGFERRLHLVDSDLVGSERVRVHLDVHCVLLLAQHLHLRHAAGHRNALRDPRLGVVVEGVQRHQLRRQGQIDDRLVGRIDLGERRGRGHALGKLPRGLGDGGLHIGGRAVHAPGQRELERNLRGAERVHRGHLLETRNRRKLILERGRHRGGHGFGTGSGKTGRLQQRREIDVRQIAHRQGPVGHHAEQRNRRHQEAGGDGTADESFRKIHDSGRDTAQSVNP
jgi:hypothetical protein